MTHEAQAVTIVPLVRKRRAPRLPGHLSASHDARPSSPSPSEPGASPIKAVIADVDAEAKLLRSSSAFVVNQIGELSRMTRSPLMHSAIAQGSVPKSRVRVSRGPAGEPVIQSVLGLPHSVRCSPPRRLHPSGVSTVGPRTVTAEQATTKQALCAGRRSREHSQPGTAESQQAGIVSAASRHSCAHPCTCYSSPRHYGETVCIGMR